jgi:hypothetical protein
MSYLVISTIAADQAIRNRVAACVAKEGSAEQAEQFAFRNALRLASEPGWSEAWESAKALRLENPDTEYPPLGEDPGVITDGMILSAVQKILGV